MYRHLFRETVTLSPVELTTFPRTPVALFNVTVEPVAFASEAKVPQWKPELERMVAFAPLTFANSPSTCTNLFFSMSESAPVTANASSEIPANLFFVRMARSPMTAMASASSMFRNWFEVMTASFPVTITPLEPTLRNEFLRTTNPSLPPLPRIPMEFTPTNLQEETSAFTPVTVTPLTAASMKRHFVTVASAPVIVTWLFPLRNVSPWTMHPLPVIDRMSLSTPPTLPSSTTPVPVTVTLSAFTAIALTW